jgi:hypothetical protein
MTETTSMQPVATGGYETTRFNAPRRGVRWLGAEASPAESFARPHAVVHQHPTARHLLRLRYRVQVVRGFELVGHGGEVLTPSQQECKAAHHDALELPTGQIVLITHLCQGQSATVIQLPVEQSDAAEHIITELTPTSFAPR